MQIGLLYIDQIYSVLPFLQFCMYGLRFVQGLHKCVPTWLVEWNDEYVYLYLSPIIYGLLF